MDTSKDFSYSKMLPIFFSHSFYLDLYLGDSVYTTVEVVQQPVGIGSLLPSHGF